MNEENEFKKLTPFKMQVLQTFPFIDADFDAITNYELLCKVVEYLNTTVDNVNLLESDYEELYNYVHNYFDNLNVTNEINQKLDNMAANGEFDALFARFVNPTLEQQNYRIDLQDQRINGQDAKITAQDNKIAQINASPLVASSTSGMTDTSRIYVNTTNGKWYYYDGDSWEIGGTYQSTGVSTDTTLTQSGVPADAKATGDAVRTRVSKNGTGEVFPQNIYGMTYTGETIMSGNILDTATFYSNGYPDIEAATGKIIIYGQQTPLVTYIIESNGLNYYFPNGSARTLVKLDSDMETAIGTTLTYVTEVDTSDCSYIAFSYNATSNPGFEITEDIKIYNVPNNWKFKELEYINKNKKVSGTIENGDSLDLNLYDDVLNDKEIIFKAYPSAFGSIRIGFYTTANVLQNYIDVSSSTLSIKNSSGDAISYSHGLTIANDLTIFIEFIKQKLRINIISQGNIYSIDNIDFNYLAGNPLTLKAISTNTSSTNTQFEVNYKACKSNIWYFGDSYLSYTNPARWLYYLDKEQYGKDVLFSGVAGGTTYGSKISFDSLITYGIPKYVVIATGMNDGSDENSQPSSVWLTNIQALINDIESNGGIPILCTIPTIPNVNNEYKNAWVKESGYRYIDFAKAVGANASGVWYTGMLSGDNVHPTALGAKALYSQVLIDLPEIFN